MGDGDAWCRVVCAGYDKHELWMSLVRYDALWLGSKVFRSVANLQHERRDRPVWCDDDDIVGKSLGKVAVCIILRCIFSMGRETYAKATSAGVKWRGYGILPSIELDNFKSSPPPFTSSRTRYPVQTSSVFAATYRARQCYPPSGKIMLLLSILSALFGFVPMLRKRWGKNWDKTSQGESREDDQVPSSASGISLSPDIALRVPQCEQEKAHLLEDALV
ncbi:hypothetical protein ARMGADRAFT_1030142 [Armillaria gallica]|uniref:Uncharacterized protein n=1 Tax=Armillaria gallica TaxID=47427 RepID=A0A2H3DE73_ARMGA|nr:hypothetical protein ARMGADRAFT_1030142 [Armillaria gallica]